MIDVVIQAIVETVIYATGHLVLWAVTLGRWNMSNGRDHVAAIVGILFWIAVGAGVWFAFFR